MPDARLQRTREAYRSDLEQAFDAFEAISFIKEWDAQVAAAQEQRQRLRVLTPPPAEPSDEDLWGV